MFNPILFKGKLGRRLFYQQSYSEQQTDRFIFHWATNIKPGDLVNCCDYWNRVVERVEHTFGIVVVDKQFGLTIEEWVFDSISHSNLIWIETTFYFTDGYQHSTSGGCAVPKWPVEEVRKYHRNCDEHGCKL
jgi:hypothetical protein